MNGDELTAAAVQELRRASREVVRELGFLQDQWTPEEISFSQCHALIEIGHHGMLTAGALAERLRLDKSTTSRTVTHLTDAGWVEARTDPGDRRRKPLVLTDEGRAKLTRIHAAANTQVLDALGILGEEDRLSVIEGMTLYATALVRARRQRDYTIRPIEPRDDPGMASVIRTVMPEFGARGPGFALNDPEVDAMHEAYAGPRAAFFVVERRGRVVGGAGIGPLAGSDEGTCELRKMYLLASARGIGLGERLLRLCRDAARERGYTTCYLETLEHMVQARRLYEKLGFRRLDAPMGDTGHFGCNCWYAMNI